MAIKDTLINIVQASELSISDKEMWQDLVETISPEMIDLFIEQIGDHGEELVAFTEEIKKQKKNIENDDIEAILLDLENQE